MIDCLSSYQETEAKSFSRMFEKWLVFTSSQGSSNEKKISDSLDDLTIHCNGINIYWFRALFGPINW